MSIRTNMFCIALLGSLVFSSCGNMGSSYGVEPYHVNEAGLEFYKMEDLESMKNLEGKKIIVDVYTSWCGWCKKMDKTTFEDPTIVDFLNENFVFVKFDAERREPIIWKGEVYDSARVGRRKTNKLAVKFLDGRLGYPSIVYLDDNLEKITKTAGYKDATKMLAELQRIAGAATS